VFLQFFTRYVLNNSFAWTEEVAIFCLVAVVFLGSAMCVRAVAGISMSIFSIATCRPRRARVLATFVDLARIALFSYLADRWSGGIPRSFPMRRMTTINFPKMPFFMAVFAAFILMAPAQHTGDDRQHPSRVIPSSKRPGAFDALGPRHAERRQEEPEPCLSCLGGFLLLMVLGVPVAVSMVTGIAGLSRGAWRRAGCDRRAAHDRRRREFPAACGAVLHSGRQPDEYRRRDRPDLCLRGAILSAGCAVASRR